MPAMVLLNLRADSVRALAARCSAFEGPDRQPLQRAIPRVTARMTKERLGVPRGLMRAITIGNAVVDESAARHVPPSLGE